jgi:hypothetical protein
VVWGRQFYPFLALSQKDEEVRPGYDMVSITSFVQAKIQHSIAASSVLSRTVAVKEINMTLIQKPFIREGRIMGLNIPGYTLFYGSGTDRPRTMILAKNRNIRMLPGFSFRDLVAVQLKYDKGKEERSIVA